MVVVDTNQSQSGSERPSVIARPRCFLLHSRVEGTLSTLRAHPNAREGTQSYEVAFALRSPVATVFSTYIDTDRWRHRGFANDVRWVQGNPWEEGSRIRVEISDPLPAVVEHVLLHYERNRELIYTSHVFGATLNTRLLFTATSEDETEIRVSVEIAGKPWPIFNSSMEPLIKKTTSRFFEDLKRDCEWSALQARQAQTSGKIIPGESDRSSQP